MYKRILITGHGGRGKTTLAEKLSKKLSIPHYSTDDFFYKVKFTERNTIEESVEEIKKVYERDEWIVEGTTSRLIKPGIEQADVIFVLQFKNIFSQYYFIIKRSFSRNSPLADMLHLLKHVTRKRYVKAHKSSLPAIKELRENYGKKVIEFNSIKEIKEYLNSLN